MVVKAKEKAPHFAELFPFNLTIKRRQVEAIRGALTATNCSKTATFPLDNRQDYVAVLASQI